MTAEILRAFTHEHNRLEVAEQEYEAAKEHHSEVLKHRNPLNPDHNRRFADAAERLELACEHLLSIMDDSGV